MNTVRDININFSGDILLSPNGDLDLANSFVTVKNSVNFIVRTDKGGYVPDSRIGGNLGSFVGDKMTKANTNSMEYSLRENISEFILNPSDFKVHVIPIELNTVGVFIAIGGQYMDEDGKLLEVEPQVLTYAFPYYQGSVTPLPE